MAVRVTCIKKDTGFYENQYTAITDFGWQNEETGKNGVSTRIQMYDFLKAGGIIYIALTTGERLYLEPAETIKGTKYIKTIGAYDGFDALLHLQDCIKT